jgi:ABC-type transporter Mla subunit MlaD
MRLKNEALVGLTVILGIVTAVIGAVWLSGRSWGEQEREVVASFARVGALAEGNPVTYRGVNVGQVRKIELSPRGTGVYVTLGVRQDVEMEGDAGVVLAPASLFGDWQAEIVSQAQYPELVFTGAPRADVLPGATLPDISELTAVAARIASDIEVLSERIQIAFTPETAVKIRSTIERVEEVSQQLSGFIDAQTRTYDQVGRNVLTSTENIRGATAAAEATMQEVRVSLQSGDVQQVLDNARQATANLNALTVELRSAAGGVPGLVARADQTIGAFGADRRDAEPDHRRGAAGAGRARPHGGGGAPGDGQLQHPPHPALQPGGDGGPPDERPGAVRGVPAPGDHHAAADGRHPGEPGQVHPRGPDLLMALLVQKYGGTSVGSPERIRAVAARVAAARRRGDRVVVVVSAMGHTTDELVALAGEVTGSDRRTPCTRARPTCSSPPASASPWRCWRWRSAARGWTPAR